MQLLEPSGGTPACTGGSPNRCIQYRGAAILLVGGTVAIDVMLQNLCSSGVSCPGQKFPDNDFIAVLSTGDLSIGVNQNGLERVMGLFYTAGQFRSAGAPGAGNLNVIIGTVAARTFCFAKGCTGSGSSDETRLFQAGLRLFPDELLPGRNRWAITPLQKFWRECVPLTVSPTYTFSPGRCPY
jgi:hypothetical protein